MRAVEAVASVAIRDGTALLVVQAIGGWHLPSAVVLPGETVQAAARRAVLEASGLKVSLDYLLGIYRDLGPPTDALQFVFTARGIAERAVAPANCPPLAFLPLDALATAPDAHLAARPLLQRILDDLRGGFRFPLALLVEE
jgi:ADP-ribose pyrophosphatase YjhB (NUDIX family)